MKKKFASAAFTQTTQSGFYSPSHLLALKITI